MSYLASVCTRFHGEFTNPSPSPRFCQTFADDSPTASNISVGKVGGGGGISPPLFLPFDRGCKISLPSNRGRIKGGIYEGKFQFRNSSLFLSCLDRIRRSRAINKGESRRFSRDLSIKISIKKWAEVAVRLDRFQVSIIRDPSPFLVPTRRNQEASPSRVLFSRELPSRETMRSVAGRKFSRSKVCSNKNKINR